MEIRDNFLLMTWRRRLKWQCRPIPSSMSAPFMLQFLPSFAALRSVVLLRYEKKDQAGRIAWSRPGVLNVLNELKLNEDAKNIFYSKPPYLNHVTNLNNVYNDEI
jgi:hypothetical protein